MSYAGDVTPTAAYEQLRSDPDAVLVDCRTHAEWILVGVPDLESIGKVVRFVEWHSFPEGTPNQDFLAELQAAGLRHDQPILFICRSGIRSKEAAKAATAAGYKNAYNVLEGFEGPRNADSHRGQTHGWKAHKLPWTQH